MKSDSPNYTLLVMVAGVMLLALGIGFWGVQLFDFDDAVPEETPLDDQAAAGRLEKKTVVPSQSSLDVETGMEVDVAATAIGAKIKSENDQAPMPTDTEEEDEPDLSVQ